MDYSSLFRGFLLPNSCTISLLVVRGSLDVRVPLLILYLFIPGLFYYRGLFVFLLPLIRGPL
jgi:hypothetical protein